MWRGETKTMITLKARRSRSACHGFGWLGGRPLFALVAGVRQRTRAQRPGNPQPPFDAGIVPLARSVRGAQNGIFYSVA